MYSSRFQGRRGLTFSLAVSCAVLLAPLPALSAPTAQAEARDIADELSELLHWADPASRLRAELQVGTGGDGEGAAADRSARLVRAVLAEWHAAEASHGPLIEPLALLSAALDTAADRAERGIDDPAAEAVVRVALDRFHAAVGRTGRVAPGLGRGVRTSSSTRNVEALEAEGEVSGSVTEEGTGTPLENVIVDVYDDSGNWVGWGFTDAAGAWEATVPAGTHFVRTYQAITHFDELYDDLPCVSGCTVTDGDPVVVSGGAQTSGIDFALDRAGSISGVLTEEGTGAPVARAKILVYEIVAGGDRRVLYNPTSRSDGSYTFPGLETGSYRVQVQPEFHVGELYDDVTCPLTCTRSGATAVAVTAGADAPGIDFSLESGGVVTGMVTDGSSGLFGAQVSVYDEAGTFVGSTQSFSGGLYEVEGLPEGTYHLVASKGGYGAELYDGLPCPSPCDTTPGTDVASVAGATTPGIDFSLAQGGSISGTVTAAETGNPVPGVTVRVYSAGGLAGSAVTALDGGYQLADLAAATYYVRTWESDRYDELYLDLPCEGSDGCDPAAGTGVPVTAGSDSPGIDFALAGAGAVWGTVDDVVDFEGISGVRVTAYDGAGRPVASTLSSASGTWQIKDLAAGHYYLVASHDGLFAAQSYFYRPFGLRPDAGRTIEVVDGGSTFSDGFYLGPIGSCGFADRLILAENMIDDVVEAAACTSLRLGGGIAIGPGAEVVLRSNGRVELWSDVAVGPDAQLQIADGVLPPRAAEEIYAEDFGDGFALGWETSNQVGDLWRIDSGCNAPPSQGPVLAFGRAAPDCDYDLAARATGWARSPRIDLSDVSPATLTIVHSWSVDPNALPGQDELVLQVSSNDGATWTDLWQPSAFSSFGFVENAFDVSAFATADFRVRLRFDSGDSLANDHAGWAIDEVVVTTESP